MLRAEQSLPQGRAPIVPVPNGQPCKPTHHSMTQTEQVILKNLYVYAYMCVMALNEKRDREFGREQGEIYGRVRREERKGGKRCNSLIISKRKKKYFFKGRKLDGWDDSVGKDAGCQAWRSEFCAKDHMVEGGYLLSKVVFTPHACTHDKQIKNENII